MYLDAEVIKINSDNTVLLKADCNKECNTCKGSLFCKQESTTFSADRSEKTVSIGSKVRVFLPPKQTIFYTILLFCFPILIMGFFLLLGHLNVIGTLTSAILSVFGLLLSYVILFVVNKKGKTRTMPTIIEVYGS